MAAIITYLYNSTRTAFLEYKDPRVEHFPLLGSPLPMAGVIAVYLTFVLHYGPKFMENRKPYDLKNIMRVYNGVQVIANIAIFLGGLMNSYLRKEFSWTCQPLDNTNTQPWMRNLLFYTYGYYLTKYLDLLDTVFFILRKKNNQITFLHVYHHAGMVFCVYLFMKFMAGSHSTMLGVINLFVHIVMYSYYFVTSLRPLQGALWWKRHITQLQLAQFGYLMFHFIIAIVWNHCGHPNLIAFTGLIQNAFMFALFFDFYYKSYIKSTSKHQITIEEEEEEQQQRQTANDIVTKPKQQ